MRSARFWGNATAILLAVAAELYANHVLSLFPDLGIILPGLMVGVPLLLGILAGLWAQGAMPTVMASWRSITRRQVVWTFLAGCAYHAYRTAVSINPMYASYIFVGDEIKTFGLLLSIVAADGLTGKNPDRREVYALAVLLYVTVALPLASTVIAHLIVTFENPLATPVGKIGLHLNNFFELLMIAGTITWVINDHRRARRERDRMHAAELSRIEAERQSVESDLQAMQARVEPQFLFNTLVHVKRAYVQDAAKGAQVLDALIAYLRAAMPKMRDTSSTVGQEFDLVRAYLQIVKVRVADRLAFVVEPPGDGVAGARMPAMLMLPLVDHSVASSVGEWHSAGSLDLRATVTGDRVRFELFQTAPADAAESDERILAIRERLAAIYAGDASLVIGRAEPDRTEIVLEIPHERVEDPAPETANDGLVPRAPRGAREGNHVAHVG